MYDRRVTRSLLIVLLLLVPAVAPAQPRASSAELGERRYRAGFEAFARRDYAAAAAAFGEAYELTHDPALLFNLGSALASAGQRDAARNALEAFLRSSPDAPNRAAVEARIRALTPAPVVVAPAAAPRPAPASSLVLSRAPPATRPSPWPTVGVVLGGVGLVAAAVGLGLYLDVDARFGRCAQVPCPREDQPRGEDVASVALLWGGGAIAVAGLVTLLVAPRRSSSAIARIVVAPTAQGLTVGGAF